MKSFFKKLSLVLAAAMIITLIPAQQTKAAGATLVYTEQAEKDKTKAITNKTLKVDETVDLKVWNATDYKTNGKGWVSSNPGVATVDKTGLVKAIAVGTTEVIYECTGHDQQPVLIQVVGDYTVDIVNQDKNNEKVTALTLEKVGDKVDFGFLGAKGYTVSKFACDWESSDKKVATVDNKGVVTAVAAGTTTISLTITEKATGKVAFAVKPVEVTVKGTTVAEVKFEQKSLNTATVTLADGKFPEKVENIKLYWVVEGVAGEGVLLNIKDYNKDKGLLTVETPFENLETYKVVVTVGEATAKDEFKAYVGTVKDFTIAYGSKADVDAEEDKAGVAYVGAVYGTTITVKDFLDANGLGTTSDGYTIKVTDKNLTAKTDEVEIANGGAIYFETVGEIHEVTAYLTNVENDKDVIQKSIKIAGTSIPAQKLDVTTLAVKANKISDDKAFKDCKETSAIKLSVDDNAAYGLAVKVYDTLGIKYEYKAGSVVTQPLFGYFTFVSSNYNILGVDDRGVLEARAAGTATITVQFNTVNENGSVTTADLKRVTFTVAGERMPASVAAAGVDTTMKVTSTNSAVISDYAGANDFNIVTLKFQVKSSASDVLTSANGVSAGLVLSDTSVLRGQHEYTANEGTDDEYKYWDDADSNHPVTVKYDADGYGYIKVRAAGIPDYDYANDTTTKASVTETVKVKVTRGNVSKEASYSITVYNYNKLKKDSEGALVADYTVSADPYVFVGGASGLGNTDVAPDSAVNVNFMLAQVRIVNNMAVYGGLVSGYTLLSYDATLKGNDLATGDVYYVAVYDGSNRTAYSRNAANNLVRVTARASYNDLAGDTASASCLKAAADSVARLTSKTYKFEVYRVNGEGTNARTTKAMRYNVSGVTKTLTNNDAANFGFNVAMKSTTYTGSTPNLVSYILNADNATLSVKKVKIGGVEYAKLDAYDSARMIDVAIVDTSASPRTKYIDTVVCYIKTGNTYTKVSKKVGVNLTVR